MPEPPLAVPPGLVEHRQFAHLVVDWLTACEAQLPDGNHRLREFTRQYRHFWQR